MTEWSFHRLPAHPTSPSPFEVVAAACRRPYGVGLCYRVAGAADRLELPRSRGGVRCDGLWQQTCFEVFIGLRNAPAYVEFNFSPRGDWAGYGFSDYRQPVGNVPADPPAVRSHWQGDALVIEADLVASAWAAPWLRGGVSVGLSAVLAAPDGAFHYHALTHPRAVPDFHDPHARVVDLAELQDGWKTPCNSESTDC